LAAAAAMMIAGLAILWASTSLENSKERSMTSQRNVAMASDIATDDLAKVSRTRAFFGHQSVGMNVLDGVSDVYAAHGVAPPAIEQAGTRPSKDGGFIDHV